MMQNVEKLQALFDNYKAQIPQELADASNVDQSFVSRHLHGIDLYERKF